MPLHLISYNFCDTQISSRNIIQMNKRKKKQSGKTSEKFFLKIAFEQITYLVVTKTGKKLTFCLEPTLRKKLLIVYFLFKFVILFNT